MNLPLACGSIFRRLFDYPLLHPGLVVLAAVVVATDFGTTAAVDPLCLTLDGGAQVDEAAVAVPCHPTALAPIVLVTSMVAGWSSISHLVLLTGVAIATLSL